MYSKSNWRSFSGSNQIVGYTLVSPFIVLPDIGNHQIPSVHYSYPPPIKVQILPVLLPHDGGLWVASWRATLQEGRFSCGYPSVGGYHSKLVSQNWKEEKKIEFEPIKSTLCMTKCLSRNFTTINAITPSAHTSYGIMAN